MKKKYLVKVFDINRQVIEDYDVLCIYGKTIKDLRKKYPNKEEFSEKLKSEMMYHFWARAEWELVILRENGRIYLIPWVGCREPEKAKIDVTDDKDFDWVAFADKHIIYQKNERKFDVYDQLCWKWDEFADIMFNMNAKKG